MRFRRRRSFRPRRRFSRRPMRMRRAGSGRQRIGFRM